MSENTDILENESGDLAENDAPESIEDEARKIGWVPPEEAIRRGVDPKDAKTAKEYIAVESWRKEVSRLKSQNQSMANVMNKIMQRIDSAELDAYNRALQDLQTQRNQAYDELNPERVRQIDEQLQQVETKRQSVEQNIRQAQATPLPETMDFINRNKDWWGQEPEAMQFAAAAEQALRRTNPNMPLDEVYEVVQNKVDVFRGKATDTPSQKRNKNSYVVPPTRASGSVSMDDNYSIHDLTRESKDLYVNLRNLRKSEYGKEYTVNDFVKDQMKAVKLGALKIEEIIKN